MMILKLWNLSTWGARIVFILLSLFRTGAMLAIAKLSRDNHYWLFVFIAFLFWDSLSLIAAHYLQCWEDDGRKA